MIDKEQQFSLANNKMTMVKGFQEISYDELMDVSGGWSWAAFTASVVAGGVAGGVGGATAGAVLLAGIGSVPGWVAGAIGGALLGGLTYATYEAVNGILSSVGMANAPGTGYGGSC